MSVKSEVLKYLETNRDDFVSGEVLASNLSVSRNAVHKAIKSLKNDGFIIDSVTNKGYRLSVNCDVLSKEGILLYLNKNYRGNIYVFDTVESTNKTAKELALDGECSGSVVIANSQTKGRGRLGRTFYSPDDSGIYMSVILKPDADANSYSIITVAACVAVFRAIYNVTGIKTSVKWVNDLFLNSKKICGILTEGIYDIESGRIGTAIVGIGINISTEDFPEEIKDIAGSLAVKGKNFILRNRLIAEILNELMVITENESLANKDFIKEYRENSFVVGKEITVHAGNRSFSAVAVDIDHNGNLVIENEDGSIQNLSYGEISVRVKE